MKDNKLYDEISFLDSALCEIEKVPNLILDLVIQIYLLFEIVFLIWLQTNKKGSWIIPRIVDTYC